MKLLGSFARRLYRLARDGEWSSLFRLRQRRVPVESLLQDLLQRGLNLFYFDARGELVPIHRYEPRFGKEIYSFVAKT
jgi:hypothetical protein